MGLIGVECLTLKKTAADLWPGESGFIQPWHVKIDREGNAFLDLSANVEHHELPLSTRIEIATSRIFGPRTSHFVRVICNGPREYDVDFKESQGYKFNIEYDNNYFKKSEQYVLVGKMRATKSAFKSPVRVR